MNKKTSLQKSNSKQAKAKGQKAGSGMNIQLVKLALEMFNNVTDLTKKVADASDPNAYAEGVNNLNEGVSDTYVQMREIIVNSNKYTDDEKLEKLKELAESEAKAKKDCSEMIMENRENVAKIALEVFGGLLTCGLYFAPAIIKRMKAAIAEKSEIPEIEFEDFQSVVDFEVKPVE